MENFLDNILEVKATLLSGAYIQIPDNVKSQMGNDTLSFLDGYTDNHHSNPWVFFKLNGKSRVRMTLKSSNAPFELCISKRDSALFSIKRSSSDEIIISDIVIEKELVHCPEQLFLGLYEHCSAGCLFCPLSFSSNPVSYSIQDMLEDLSKFNMNEIKAIGITTGIPLGKTHASVATELANAIRVLLEKTGNTIPIGVSTKQPTAKILQELKAAGASEIRLNLEVSREPLANKLMPKKNIYDTLRSIEMATEIFGRGKVSSNIIIGVGEEDDDVIFGIEEVAKLGAIATLYPYDPFPEAENLMKHRSDVNFSIPSSDRLLHLAIEHKKILKNHHLHPSTLKTMCPACSASHIMPFIDF